ncbi:MAG: isochorismatase family cysteine hydrolase [Candidatus Bathyarchaeia archaeon]
MVNFEDALKVFRSEAPIDDLKEAKQRLIDEYLKPTSLREACLLIVDMQRGFLEEGAALEVPAGRTVCLPNIKKLLDKARKIGLSVVFTKYIHEPGSLRLSSYPFAPEVFEHQPGAPIGPYHPSSCCLRGDPSTEIVDELKPIPGEVVIEKCGYDAFHETPLDSELRSKSVKYLYVCGVMTDICVDSTIKSGFHREYRITVAVDAVGTIWPEIQNACLDIWKRKFARMKTVNEILEEWDFIRGHSAT